MKKPLSLFLSLALLLSLCACGGAAGGPGPDPSDSPSPSESAAPSDSAAPSPSPAIEADLTRPLYEFASGLPDSGEAMKIDGAVIPNEIYFYWLSSYCYYIDSSYAMYGMAADFTNEAMAADLVDAARDMMIYYAMVNELAAQNGVSVTAEQEAEMQEQLDTALKDAGYGKDVLLRGSGLSEESFHYVNTAGYLRDNLKEKLVEEPTDGDLAQFAADKNVFSCKHILLKTISEDQKDADGNVTQTAEEYNAAQKALAQSLLERLQAEGDNVEGLLDQLAEEHSEDGRGEDGRLAAPDGYTFDDDDSLVGGFREAALAVEVGQLTDIVETDYGYHIILRLPVDPDVYEGYRGQCRDETMETIINAAAEQADVSASDALDTVSVADFYARYNAWRAAFVQSIEDAGAVG